MKNSRYPTTNQSTKSADRPKVIDGEFKEVTESLSVERALNPASKIDGPIPDHPPLR